MKKIVIYQENVVGQCVWCGYKYIRVACGHNLGAVYLFKKSKQWKYKRKESLGMLVKIDTKDGSGLHL